jgi:hypothetical protein
MDVAQTSTLYNPIQRLRICTTGHDAVKQQ